MKFCFRLSLETKLFLSLRTVVKFLRTTNFNFSIPKQKTSYFSIHKTDLFSGGLKTKHNSIFLNSQVAIPFCVSF